MKLISSWSIVIEFEDATQERLADVPKHVAEVIDEWLGHVEQERW